MKISPEEQAAIREVIRLGDRFGFGNLISHMRTAWAKRLMLEYDLSDRDARDGAVGGTYPFAMHDDLLARGEWDETGERYKGK